MKTLTITLPSSEVELAPTPRSNLKRLKELLLLIQSEWLRQSFSTADLCANDEVWGWMTEAIALLPRTENPAIAFEDLDLISNDYEQIEQIFLAQKSSVLNEGGVVKVFDFDKLVGSKIVEIHRFNPVQLLMNAEDSRKNHKKK